MKIVVNKCFGGFGLSREAYKFLGLEWDGYGYAFGGYSDRSNPALIKCIEKLREKANGRYANLKIIEIPNGIQWKIEEYDGVETVHDIHRSW